MNKTLVALSIALTLFALTVLVGCGEKQAVPIPMTSPSADERAAAEQAKAEIGTWGFDLTAMKDSVALGDDFNLHVNGRWVDEFEIPADRARWGIFDQLAERTTEQIHEIVVELADTAAEPGSLEQKVGDFYATWMDVETANAKGAAPLAEHLQAIANIGDKDELIQVMADQHYFAPFALGIIPDPADTTTYSAYVEQGGLGLPDRDYYLKEDDKFVEIRAAYQSYMTDIQTMAGIDNAADKTAAIFALENDIAQFHWTQAESRDIQKIYNPMSPAELQALAPQINWQVILNSRGLGSLDTIVVAQPDVFTNTAALIESVDLDTWKSYLAFHFIRRYSTFLSEEFDNRNFEFYGKTLQGLEAQRDRWKRGTDLVNANLGEAVGKIYIARHFPPAAKQQMDELVENLRVALKERLEQNTWMDDATRKQALLKLSTFEPRIGYTNKWKDYANLTITKGDLLGNELRVNEFLWQQEVDLLGGPVDRELWDWPPQVVNASYNPLLNQLTFPAGILQPPFFDPNADPAVNYGAIGAVIGHEMGHGFDDQGRRFDEKGLIRDWWTATADERFTERTSKLVEQYNAYSPIEGMNVNGELTLGENIGDLGGLQMAYSAYQRYKAEHGEPPVIDGYTGDQRFFLGFGQVWRGKIREEALRQRLVIDPHSPAEYRINGTVRNLDAWYEAFDVPASAALYLPPEQRVRIW